MNRRRFMRNTLGAGVFLIKPAVAAQNPTPNDPVEFTTHGGLVIERAVTGKPHARQGARRNSTPFGRHSHLCGRNGGQAAQ